MSGDRARQRNLRHTIGETAAAAVVESQDQVKQLVLQHRVLAAQMLDFEKTVATVRASRAGDHAHYDQLLNGVLSRLTACEDDIAACGRREARLADNLRLEHARTVQFESMGFWRRLRWTITGARPPFYDPVKDTLVDRSPTTAYPGDGL